MLKNNIKLLYFSIILSVLNFLLFHFGFFKFFFQNIDYKTLNGVWLFISLVVLMIVLNAFVFSILLYLSKYIGKFLLILFFFLSAIASYFVNTYNVIVDESMIGNVLNTNYDESSSFFSLKLIVYIVLFGLLPSIFIYQVKYTKPLFKNYIKYILLTLLFIVVLAFANAPNWLWIDKNSKQLGGLAMPWSYNVNLALFYKHKHEANKKEILLPDLKLKNNEKAVVVLVIGESARRQNFSLYGYKKTTNPLLSKVENLNIFEANSCSTYTTASLKCILEHINSGELYEILPNYLNRNKVEVFWRTTNWGEPPLHINNIQKREDLLLSYKGNYSEYDEILTAGIKEQIESSDNNKILIVLHTSTSHGPTYNKKYPPKFEIFKPVCNSVELAKCSQQELINAYDNSIIYTDFILHDIISQLKLLETYKSTMIYVSDHGESLGEKNLYMHGLPMSFAPKEQYEIPFIVWTSEKSKRLKPNKQLSQHHVFHSVMNFLGLESSIYNEEMNMFID
jgi:lipid A ethanolaminephosphotransferase